MTNPYPVVIRYILTIAIIGQGTGQGQGQGQRHTSTFNCTSPAELVAVKGRSLGQHTGVRSRLQCARACSMTCSCDVMQFCPGDKTCDLFGTCPGCASNMNIAPTCPNGDVPWTATTEEARLACSAQRYLVTETGGGVTDAQLNASSFWCQDLAADPTHCPATPDGHGARYARRTNSIWPWDCWVPFGNPSSSGEYIQVDFWTAKIATGVELHGRVGCCEMYVTAFKVSHSLDCVNFDMIPDGLGNDKVFNGCKTKDEIVSQCFEEPITARCIRLHPTSWTGLIALRFDILGL